MLPLANYAKKTAFATQPIRGPNLLFWNAERPSSDGNWIFRVGRLAQLVTNVGEQLVTVPQLAGSCQGFPRAVLVGGTSRHRIF